MLITISVGASALAEASMAEAMRINIAYSIMLRAVVLALFSWSSGVQCRINVALSVAEYYRITG